MEYKYTKFLTALVMELENDKLFEIRCQALQKLYSRANYYLDKGFRKDLPEAFFIKKAEMVLAASSKEEIKKILKPSEPYDDGNQLVPRESKYHVEEEELMIWSETSLMAPLCGKGFKRYQELFEKFFPEEIKELFHNTLNAA